MDQKNFVDWILHLTGVYNGHFHVLAIDFRASDAHIQKQYRKIAVRLHPDRNKAPRANDAYLALSLAKHVLLTEEFRFRYMAYQTYDPEHPSGPHPEYPQPSMPPPPLYRLPGGGYRFDYTPNTPSPPSPPPPSSPMSDANKVNYFKFEFYLRFTY